MEGASDRRSPSGHRQLGIGALIVLGLMVAGVFAHVTKVAPAAPAAPAGCAARVAVLGADMSPAGRFNVERALRVGPHTLQMTETMVDERAAAHGLVPAALLGQVAVSSAVLKPLPAGSGLTVTLNAAITLDTAQTYANALLTMGVADAEVGVAAPLAQQAWGTTALLGLLRAAGAACLPVGAVRRDLAIREVVLSSELAQSSGREAAPALLFALKSDAVLGRDATVSALTALVTRDAAAQHVGVPAVLQPHLVAFLRDLVAGGAYDRVARAHPSVAGVGPLQVMVRLGGPSGAGASATSAPSRAGAWRGTVVVASGAGLAARLRDGVHDYAVAPTLLVYRNGQRSSLGALHAGDAVTITTNAAGVAMLVQAASAPVGSGTVGSGAGRHTASSSGTLNMAVIGVLAVLLLLALLLLPLLIGLLRRRQAGVAGGAAPPSTFMARAPRTGHGGPYRRRDGRE